mgnify:CR=1 FL=1
MALPSIDTAQTFTAIEDTNYTLAISDFTGEGTYTDGDDGTVINAIIIKSLPDVVFGVLKLDNVAVSIDQEITKTDIDANKLVFVPVAEKNGSNATSFNFVFKDGADEVSTPPTAVWVNLTSVEDAPVNTVPIAQTILEDASLAFNSGNSKTISVADVDGDVASAKLTVTQGTLAVTLGSTGATISAGVNGTATVTLSGTATQINAALQTLVYTGAADYNGSDTLTIRTTDTSVTPKTTEDTVAITLTAISDTAVISAASDQDVGAIGETSTTNNLTDTGTLTVVDVDGNNNPTGVTTGVTNKREQ